MNSVFSRFDSYDFESDARFQEGLRSLQSTNGSGEDRLLDMKLFYFNRFVAPIDRSAYKQWRDSNRTSELAEECTDSADAHLTFAEVMKLVHEGKELPGVKKLDIQPTNEALPSSQMQSPLKPWEKSLHSA